MARSLTLALLLAVFASACATTHHASETQYGVAEYEVEIVSPTDRPRRTEGDLRGALESGDVDQIIARHEERIEECYDREQVVATPRTDLSNFDFELRILPAGPRHSVSRVRASHPEQVSLESCIAETLRDIRFPRYNGEPLAVVVKIQPPTRE